MADLPGSEAPFTVADWQALLDRQADSMRALYEQGKLTHAALMAQLTPDEGARYEAFRSQGYGKAEALAMLDAEE